jgi:hypothetical protein
MTDAALAALLRDARAHRWCTDPYCAACPPVEFRAGLAELAGADAAGLERALAEMDFADWYDLPEWEGALRMALGALGSLERVDRVLAAWLPRLDDHVRIAGAVLYYVVRPQRAHLPVAERWIAASAELAVRLEDSELLEQLVFTLREDFLRWPALRAAARRLRGRAPRLRKALQRLPPAAPDA